MRWQDALFTVGGFVFSWSLLPTIMDRRARVPVATSLPTGLVLGSYVVAFITLGLFVSAASTALTASAWLFIARRRRA